MKTRVLILPAAIAAALCISISSAPAKTASCPCSPCKCSPCTCGGGGSKSGGGKHHDDHHDHHGHHDRGDGGSVGVGVNVDLSGVGHRTREADPFAAGGSDKPVAHTEEKRTTKHKEHEPTTTSFDEIKLTGKEAKDENSPPNTFNISDDQPKVAETPVPGTGKKPKPTWSKPIQDWLDARAAVAAAQENEGKAGEAYLNALQKFYQNSNHLKQLQSDANTAYNKAKKEGATKEDKEAWEKAQNAVQDQVSALNKDFDSSPEGKKLLADAKDAKAAVKTAKQAADNAAKDIDQATQKMVLKKMEKWAKNQGKEGEKKTAKE